MVVDDRGGDSDLSVTLREHLEAMVVENARRLEGEIAHAREVARIQREADQLAVEKALEAAKEIAEKHNDLIRAAEKRDDTYATQDDMHRVEAWQAKMTGGILVIATIGIANFVRLWTG